MENDHLKKSAILLIAVAVAFSMFAGGVGATPAVDTETANTSTTSELRAGDTITYNSSTETVFGFQTTNSSSPKVEITQNGTVLEDFDNDSSEVSFDGAYASGSDTLRYYNLTLGDDEDGYDGLIADAGENVTLHYNITNDTALTNPSMKNVTVYFDNHDNKSFTRMGSSEVDAKEVGSVPSILNNIPASIPVLGSNVSDGPAQSKREDIGVNGQDQDQIKVYIENADAEGALDVTHENAGSNGLSWFGTAEVNGTAVPIIQADADGPDWLDTDEEAYASVNEDGTVVTIENAGEVMDEDQSTAEVRLVGAEKAGPMYAWGLVDSYGGSVFAQANAAQSAIDLNGNPDFEE